jgi:prepilin-type N-terminal cleavage/methylation domain-containing protein
MKISHNKTTNRNAHSGFTLVELMVSLTIFSIVMTISTGTLLVLIDLNAKAQALYSATTNLSFALDSMTREMRTGYHYYCSASYSGTLSDIENDNRDCIGGEFIAFMREEDSTQMAYRLNGSALEVNDGSGWMAITAEEVFVDVFSVTVNNSDSYENGGGDQSQPTVDIVVRGYVNNGLDEATDFNIQTHVVQRRLDII